MTQPYTIAEDGLSITCNRCGKTSYNLKDVQHRYCGHCHIFHEKKAGDKPEYKDHPFDEIERSCRELIRDGITIHQKFTCGQCGSRQVIEEPNVLYTAGTCEECGHVTDIKAQGCNYLAHFRITNAKP